MCKLDRLRMWPPSHRMRHMHGSRSGFPRRIGNRSCKATLLAHTSEHRKDGIDRIRSCFPPCRLSCLRKPRRIFRCHRLFQFHTLHRCHTNQRACWDQLGVWLRLPERDSNFPRCRHNNRFDRSSGARLVRGLCRNLPWPKTKRQRGAKMRRSNGFFCFERSQCGTWFSSSDTAFEAFTVPSYKPHAALLGCFLHHHLPENHGIDRADVNNR